MIRAEKPEYFLITAYTNPRPSKAMCKALNYFYKLSFMYMQKSFHTFSNILVFFYSLLLSTSFIVSPVTIF